MNIPDPMNVTEGEYVLARFRSMPREMIAYLGCDDDSKAALEVAFRAEYFRRRHDVLEKLLSKAYSKYLAAKRALSQYTDLPEEEIRMEIENDENGFYNMKEVPVEF